MSTSTSTITEAKDSTQKKLSYREQQRRKLERRDSQLLAFMIFHKPPGVIRDEMIEYMQLSPGCIYESLARLRAEGIVILTPYRRPGRKSFQPIYMTKGALDRLYRIAAAQEAAEAAASDFCSDNSKELQHV